MTVIAIGQAIWFIMVGAQLCSRLSSAPLSPILP
jgi:hypothetical protein